MTIRIGTRSSNLALWQANAVQKKLEKYGISSDLVTLSSTGDRSLGGQLSGSVGQFIHAIDDSLLSGEVDIAVHSSKDVPVEVDRRIENLAYLERGCTSDLVIVRKSESIDSLDKVLNGSSYTPLATILDHFPHGAMFGTVSGRRQSFLLSQRPDIIPLAVRGHVENRLTRLLDGRVDAVVLAEVGISRLNSVGVLDDVKKELSAFRIDPSDWPTAPGQGAISVHCKKDRFQEFKSLRLVLNHEQTEQDVTTERRLLKEVGGGCLFPAGIAIEGQQAHLQVSPENWRAIFCQGSVYDMFQYAGIIDGLKINLPVQPLESFTMKNTGPRYISTLNSERISRVLAHSGIAMENIPVVDLEPRLENWPVNFLNAYDKKRHWPYLVLTSPFAAKCAVAAAEVNTDIGRIPWLAIGEGTARACFQLGVTVAVCARARNARELGVYITEHFPTNTTFLLPQSNLSSPTLKETLEETGFDVKSWVGYENKAKEVGYVEINSHDVLVLSSASSARSWAKNSLRAPNEILCMGESTRSVILSLEHYSGSRVSVLDGPTSESLIQWWRENRMDYDER